MRKLSEKSKLVTAKVGLRYETVYYYKQKVVNWEYTASPSYDTIVFIELVSLQIRESNVMCLASYKPLSVVTEKYLTESSFVNKHLSYVTVFTNKDTRQWEITLASYTNALEGSNVGGSIHNVLNKDTPSVTHEDTVYYDNINEDVLFTIDTITTQSTHNNLYGGHHKDALVSSVSKGIVFKQDNNDTKDVRTFHDYAAVFYQYSHSSITILPTSVDLIDINYQNRGSATVNVLASIITPVLDIRHAQQTLNNIFNITLEDLEYTSAQLLTFKSATNIS